LIQSLNHCDAQSGQLHQLQTQLSLSVPREDLERARHSCDHTSNELYDTREQLKTLRERFEKQMRDIEELDSERKQQLQQLICLEQQANEQQRDLELKDIKIESLENILKRRDQQTADNASHVVSQLEDKLRALEGDREKLIKDNMALIRQLQHFSNEHEKHKWQSHEQNSKQDEITRLYASNLKALEDRCRYLERQLESNRKPNQTYQFLEDTSNKENSSVMYNNLNYHQNQSELDLDGAIKSPTF
jgi:chromosome segregation ATPase